MKKICRLLLILAVIGCAKVSVETTKPIQVDINMRVDIYQHVEQDVQSINDQIYGNSAMEMNSIFIAGYAYAQEVSEGIDAAIQRRKVRANQILTYFEKDYVGENKDALLSLRDGIPEDMQTEVKNAVLAENKDRSIIYFETTKKNNADIAGVRKIFFDGDYKRAAKGYWFEVYDQTSGKHTWKKK